MSKTPEVAGLADEIESTHQSIATAGRLHWFHWAVVGLSLFVTLAAWQVTSGQIEDKTEARFDRDAEQAVSLIQERMQRYEDALWGGVSAIRSQGDDITGPEWLIFSESLKIDQKYPGVNGIGVIHHVEPESLDAYIADQRVLRPDFDVHPRENTKEHLPITYIEPVATNAAAVGLDMTFESNRYGGIVKARISGEAQITGPIVLVQDAEQTPGFLFFAPWYRDGDNGDIPSRVESFQGVVYAPFVVKNLLDGALAKETREIGIRITDITEVVYDEHTPTVPDFDPNPVLSRVISVHMYGRQWDFDIRTAKSFRAATQNSEPTVILVGGLLLDSLLFTLFLLLSRSNRRALRYAADVSGDLQRESQRLAKSNAELETFAYVASHDLKTPLRGIEHLTEYLEDDLAECAEATDANPDIGNNLHRIREQVRRMSALIDGVLNYSRIESNADTQLGSVNMVDLIDELRTNLDVGVDQIRYSGPSEVVVPAPIYFKQVVQNLVNNAFHHHDDRPVAIIELHCEAGPDAVVMTVADNGPGIERQFHERIFGVFETLGADGSGTGIGLSIVKKVVDNQGGQISLRSAPSQGSTFKFSWPSHSPGPAEGRANVGPAIDRNHPRSDWTYV